MSNNKKKVLIVDDAAFTRNMLRKIIDNTTYTEVVGEAINGNEAITLYKKLKPDLVTMDLVMPEKGAIMGEAHFEAVNIKGGCSTSRTKAI